MVEAEEARIKAREAAVAQAKKEQEAEKSEKATTKA